MTSGGSGFGFLCSLPGSSSAQANPFQGQGLFVISFVRLVNQSVQSPACQDQVAGGHAGVVISLGGASVSLPILCHSPV